MIISLQFRDKTYQKPINIIIKNNIVLLHLVSFTHQRKADTSVLEGRIRVIGVEKHSRRSKMGTLQGKGLRFRREGSDWRVERKREPGESCGRTVLG